MQRVDIIVSRQEAECILNCLKGTLLKAEAKLRAAIIGQVEQTLHPKVNPKSNGWAPMGRIRPSWPSNFVKRTRQSSPRKPKKDKEPTVTKTLSPQEILAELSL